MYISHVHINLQIAPRKKKRGGGESFDDLAGRELKVLSRVFLNLKEKGEEKEKAVGETGK